MGKNRVWNKGKHNGGGLAKKNVTEKESAESATPAESAPEIPDPRIDTVKPMNRSNWVTRPTRVTPKGTKE
jgi:hypothetical protein